MAMDWLARVHLIAETDRVLQAKHRKAHRRWTARQTAHRLRVTPSVVSMCTQLERGLDRWPELAGELSLRRAYDAYCKRMQENGRTHRTQDS